MEPKETLYSIGRFAELSDMSVKQLRYLDEKGILVPQIRKSDNRYRYYVHEQFNQIAVIKTLRDLGLPFDEIVHVLQRDDIGILNDAVQKRIEQAEADLKDMMFQYERLVAFYTQLLKSETSLYLFDERRQSQPFSLVEMPEQTVIFTRSRVQASSKQLFIDRYFELERLCREMRAVPASGMMALFRDGYMQQFERANEDLETMIAINRGFPLSKNVRRFGGFKGVSAYHKGHYRDMKKLYIEMESWAKAQQLDIMDIALEIYILGPDMTLDSKNYVTQVIIPLKGSTL